MQDDEFRILLPRGVDGGYGYIIDPSKPVMRIRVEGFTVQIKDLRKRTTNHTGELCIKPHHQRMIAAQDYIMFICHNDGIRNGVEDQFPFLLATLDDSEKPAL